MDQKRAIKIHQKPPTERAWSKKREVEEVNVEY